MWTPGKRTAGSSPLTRGKPPRSGTNRPRGRLIPAHAGKTRARRSPGSRSWAHPRSRGENFGLVRDHGRHMGSSPLTRGKRFRRGRRPPTLRLIPAHAGKTTRIRTVRNTSRAHPRSRGENALDFNPNHTLGGSSPLTRGKRAGELELATAPRLIPAHAGKTACAGL